METPQQEHHHQPRSSSGSGTNNQIRTTVKAIDRCPVCCHKTTPRDYVRIHPEDGGGIVTWYTCSSCGRRWTTSWAKDLDVE